LALRMAYSSCDGHKHEFMPEHGRATYGYYLPPSTRSLIRQDYAPSISAVLGEIITQLALCWLTPPRS